MSNNFNAIPYDTKLISNTMYDKLVAGFLGPYAMENAIIRWR